MKKIFLLLLMLMLFISCKKDEQKGKQAIVSILPQKYFVKRIGGEKINVSVMVRPGHSPATYEPLPKQMQFVSNAKLYFKIGVPFEKAWIGKIRNANEKIKIIDTRDGIVIRNMDAFYSILEYKKRQKQNKGIKDPHIWLSPKLVKTQARTIYRALLSIDKENEKYYKVNLDIFLKDLDNLSTYIEKCFKGISIKKFMVFHPAFGYFADQFGLTQIPIEIEGKSPSPKDMERIISFCKNEKIRVIFVQAQFNTENAKTIARAINGSVIKLDPLAENYIENLKNIANTIKESIL